MKKLPDSELLYRALEQIDANILYEQFPNIPRNVHSTCPSCHGTKVVTVDGVDWECNCADQIQRHKHYTSAGIGINYQQLSWGNWHNTKFDISQLDDYRDNIDKYINNGIGIILHGPNGSGKSFICTMILKDLIRKHNKRCYMIKAKDLVDMVREGWSTPRNKEILNYKITNADVLFIDDPGKELIDANNWNDKHAKMTIEGIIRERVQSNKAIFLTTNYDMAGIASVYGKGFYSMLQESCFQIEVPGSDYRKQIHADLQNTGKLYIPIF